MVKFTLKGISNLTESPAYFQQVNGIYRKDGALALVMIMLVELATVIMQTLDSLFTTFDPTQDLLITPNNRLATYLQQAHAKNHGELTWRTTPILPLQVWLEQLWQSLLARGLTQQQTLLTTTQSKLIWQAIINENSQEYLLNPYATAEQAMRAWQSLQQWDLSLDDPGLVENETQQQFISWARKYQQHCEHEYFLDPYCLTRYLTQQSEYLPLPNRLLLVNFIEQQPNMAKLLVKLEQQGCPQQSFSLQQLTEEQKAHACQDVTTEIKQMACWAKATWQNNPKAEIACIVPELSTLYKQLQATFQKLLLLT